jgi:hypothetical protein
MAQFCGVCLAVACGGESNDAVASRAGDDAAQEDTGGQGNGSGDSDASAPANEDSDGQRPASNDGGGDDDAVGATPTPDSPNGNDAGAPASQATYVPPPPILPDVDPATPISDLSSEEFEQVCAAYVETLDGLIENLAASCDTQAVSAAQDSGATDTEEYRAACAEARAVCVEQSAAAALIVSVLECNDQSCAATLDQFDSCRTQVAALDAVAFRPIAALDAPSCDEVTPALGAAYALRVAATLLVSSAGVSAEQGGSPFQDDSPCDAINNQCPGFAAPLGVDLVGGMGTGGSGTSDAGAP